MLFDCHQMEDSILLRTVADEASGIFEVFKHAVALDSDLTTCRHDISGQALECGRLASSIDTEKSEALATLDSKGDFLDCRDRLGAQL